MINAKYTAQLIAMVTDETKAQIKAAAEAREVSISQVAREYLEAGQKVLLGPDLPDPDTETVQRADGTLANAADENEARIARLRRKGLY